jgi:hypothetical protein
MSDLSAHPVEHASPESLGETRGWYRSFWLLGREEIEKNRAREEESENLA